MIIEDVPLDELTRAWDGIREDYDDLFNDEYNRTVLDCAARLAAGPDGESAYVWTIGLMMMAPYVAWGADDHVAPEAMAALKATDGALRDRPCDHELHPYQEHEAEYDEYLADQLRQLPDENADWDEDRPREEWLCPRNVAGFARIAMDVIEPGSATNIPPRLPVRAQNTIDRLSALLNGYPDPGTDIGEEISYHASVLRTSDPAERPGCLLVVMALTWIAVSDLVIEQRESAIDDLISALEETLPHYAGVSCIHDRHTPPPGSGPAAAEVGIMLTTPGGRALYEQGRREGRDAPVEHLRCPVALTEIVEESLSALRAWRDESLDQGEPGR
ncbi:hypothetical protein ACIHFE_33145 [Streptomyces sp. NPDC052396]|uniref:hypothetical protein n=1 Tax=Streptomyces sp. NPDC052396 TaxID=3365689 RepID=UPI0037CFC244